VGELALAEVQSNSLFCKTFSILPLSI